LEDINNNSRPIFGILTEPIRGDMKKNNTNNVEETVSANKNQYLSYIPKAHV